MPEILNPVASGSVSKKTRAHEVRIINPIDAKKCILFLQEEALLLNGTVLSKNAILPLTIPVDDVVGERVTVQDPVVGAAVEISVAGIALAIEELYVRWFNANAAPAEGEPS